MTEAEIHFVVPGAPVPFARAGGGVTRKRFTPQRQRNYATQVQWHCQVAMKRGPILKGAIELELLAVFPLPKGKKEMMARHTKRPDADNIAKLVSDALNGFAYKDDAQISDVKIQKRYGANPRLVVTLRALEHWGVLQ